MDLKYMTTTKNQIIRILNKSDDYHEQFRDEIDQLSTSVKPEDLELRSTHLQNIRILFDQSRHEIITLASSAQPGEIENIFSDIIDECPDKWQRNRVVGALGWIKTEQAEKILIPLLDDTDSMIQETSLIILGESGSKKVEDKILSFLDSDDFDLKISAVDAAGNIRSEKAIDALIAIVYADEEDCDDIQIRQHVACALGKIGTERALDYLVDLLYHDRPGVQDYAFESLSKNVTVDITERLERVVNDKWYIHKKKGKSEHWRIPRNSALVLLIEKKYRNDDDKLIELLDEKDFSVKYTAADALAVLKSKKAEDKLIKLLNEEESLVVISAIRGLEVIKSKKAEKTLVELLNHKDDLVRWNAKRALDEIRS
jgi:HEAT repeat protein